MSIYQIVEIQQLVCGESRYHVARLCNLLTVRYHLVCIYSYMGEMEHSVVKFSDVRFTCITCSWRRPHANNLPWSTIYTVLLN